MFMRLVTELRMLHDLRKVAQKRAGKFVQAVAQKSGITAITGRGQGFQVPRGPRVQMLGQLPTAILPKSYG